MSRYVWLPLVPVLEFEATPAQLRLGRLGITDLCGELLLHVDGAERPIRTAGVSVDAASHEIYELDDLRVTVEEEDERRWLRYPAPAAQVWPRPLAGRPPATQDVSLGTAPRKRPRPQRQPRPRVALLDVPACGLGVVDRRMRAIMQENRERWKVEQERFRLETEAQQ